MLRNETHCQDCYCVCVLRMMKSTAIYHRPSKTALHHTTHHKNKSVQHHNLILMHHRSIWLVMLMQRSAKCTQYALFCTGAANAESAHWGTLVTLNECFFVCSHWDKNIGFHTVSRITVKTLTSIKTAVYRWRFNTIAINICNMYNKNRQKATADVQ